MTTRAVLHVSIVVLCASIAVAADEPRFTPAEVRRAADAAARQRGYDLKTYTRGEPSYDPVSKTWGVNNRLKSSASPSTGEGVLSVDVADTTGFTSTRFWLATPTPVTSAAPSRRDLGTFYLIVLGVVDGILLLSLLLWKRRPKHTIVSET